MTIKYLGILGLLLSSMILLSACADSRTDCSAYYSSGYQTGYSEGFEAARPGSNGELGASAKRFYKSVIIIGALKLIAAIGFTSWILFKRSQSEAEVVGKIMFAALGAMVGGLSALYLNLSSLITSVFLFSMPGGAIAGIAAVTLAAFLAFAVFERLFIICNHEPGRSRLEAWYLLLLSFWGAILIMTAGHFVSGTPDTTKYLGANIFAGFLLGGLYWIGNSSLNNRFKLD